MCRVAIIGAGISGLSIAKRLLQSGLLPVIYEKETDIGGLCRTRMASGYTFDLSGGHVFNSKFAEVKQWVFDLLSEEQWQASKRIAKIYFHDKLIDYPFELALAQLDAGETIDCLEDFISGRTGKEPENFKEWLVWLFGRSIADKYMLPYNSKIWNYDLQEMSTDWVRGKMPIPTIRQIITSVVKSDASESLMPHSTYYYPHKGGIRNFIDAIASGLNEIHRGVPIESLEMIEGEYVVNGSSSYDLVINTAPLPELVGVIKGMPDEVTKAINDLKYNSIKTVLFACPHDNDYSWIYLPDPSIKPHRIVYQGNFAPGNAPAPDNSSLTVEVIGDYPLGKVIEAIKGKIQFGEYLDEHYTKYAYVIFDRDRARNMELIRHFFADVGIELLGRFAEWEYYNMDVCIERAFALFNKLHSRITGLPDKAPVDTSI
jgi:protoporphyrinogen oxidase